MQWLDSIAGAGFAQAILWTLLALVALAVVLGLVRLARSYSSATFVAGGRNRKTRLAVMDATAIDNHRRLVLVRRDDVEHLILIGGPTDVVVEQDIRLHAQQPRRPFTGDAAPEQPSPLQQRARPAEASAGRPVQLPQRELRGERMPSPRGAADGRGEPRLVRAAAPVAAAAPPSAPVPAAAPSPAAVKAAAPPPPQAANASASQRDQAIDDQLMKELEVSVDGNGSGRPQNVAATSLDDEMTRLLGELSSKR